MPLPKLGEFLKALQLNGNSDNLQIKQYKCTFGISHVSKIEGWCHSHVQHCRVVGLQHSFSRKHKKLNPKSLDSFVSW